MQITVQNPSGLARRHWVTVTAPQQLTRHLTAARLRFVAPGAKAATTAYRAGARGDIALFDVEVEFEEGQTTLVGTLENSELPAQPQRMHPWVGDLLTKLVPVIRTRRNGQTQDTSSIRLTFSSPSQARTRWHMVAKNAHGIVLEWWADIWHDDPVVDVYGCATWSDRNDPNWNTHFEGVWLLSGEMIVLDFGQRHIVSGPFRDHLGQHISLLATNLPINDGAGLPLSGRMLCFVDVVDEETNLIAQRAIRDLRAASMSPVYATAQSWNGYWMPHRWAASVPSIAQLESETWARFVTEQQTGAGWFAPRPLGCSKTPGQTGAQEDFGATKGSLALVAPRQLHRMRYSIQADAFRGFIHYEANGSPLSVEQHPRWITWSGITHWSAGVSQDRLGKSVPVAPASGWNGYDLQHRSQNNLAAYITLTDDPLAQFLARNILTTDAADIRYKNGSVDSARGQGRPIGAWAALYAAFGRDSDALLAQITSQARRSRAQMMLLGNGNAMRVLSHLPPDARVPVYVDGILAPTVSLWEHALALVGFEAARRVAPSDDLHIICTQLSMLLRYAITEGANGTLATSIHWNGGDPPLGKLLDNGSGVAGWIRAGLLIASEVLPDDEVLADWRALNKATILNETRLEWAEWWAAVNLDIDTP